MFFKKGGKGPPSPPPDEEKTLLVGRPTPQARLSWPARDGDRAATEPVTGSAIPPDRSYRAAASAQAAPAPAPAPAAAPRQAPADEDRTRLISVQRPRDEAQPAAAPAAQAPGRADREIEPVVGWLVVVKGPGKGRSVEIAAGSSPIGRGEGQRIRLDFGDDQISRENHATLTFDVRSSRFFLNHGGGRNLTYLAGEPVLVPVELKGGEVIALGDTELQFVRFCGPDFSWS